MANGSLYNIKQRNPLGNLVDTIESLDRLQQVIEAPINREKEELAGRFTDLNSLLSTATSGEAINAAYHAVNELNTDASIYSEFKPYASILSANMNQKKKDYQMFHNAITGPVTQHLINKFYGVTDPDTKEITRLTEAEVMTWDMEEYRKWYSQLNTILGAQVLGSQQGFRAPGDVNVINNMQYITNTLNTALAALIGDGIIDEDEAMYVVEGNKDGLNAVRATRISEEDNISKHYLNRLESVDESSKILKQWMTKANMQAALDVYTAKFEDAQNLTPDLSLSLSEIMQANRRRIEATSDDDILKARDINGESYDVNQDGELGTDERERYVNEISLRYKGMTFEGMTLELDAEHNIYKKLYKESQIRRKKWAGKHAESALILSREEILSGLDYITGNGKDTAYITPLPFMHFNEVSTAKTGKGEIVYLYGENSDPYTSQSHHNTILSHEYQNKIIKESLANNPKYEEIKKILQEEGVIYDWLSMTRNDIIHEPSFRAWTGLSQTDHTKAMRLSKQLDAGLLKPADKEYQENVEWMNTNVYTPIVEAQEKIVDEVTRINSMYAGEYEVYNPLFFNSFSKIKEDYPNLVELFSEDAQNGTIKPEDVNYTDIKVVADYMAANPGDEVVKYINEYEPLTNEHISAIWKVIYWGIQQHRMNPDLYPELHDFNALAVMTRLQDIHGTYPKTEK